MKADRRTWVLLAGLMLVATTAASAGGFFNPGGISPPPAFDLNPDPDIVEVLIVAQQSTVNYGMGNRTAVYNYNGSIPGPTIEGKVGDTLIVHFFNQLPEDTSIHWHGLELPAEMDGSHIAQNPVPPGGYFRYEFDLLEASLFWYHPHFRTHAQVELGLHGALMVNPAPTESASGFPQTEHLLVLDDVLLDSNGQVEDPYPTDPLERAATQLNGREGNVLLVNGRANAKTVLRRNVPHRFRVVNVSNVRFMRLSIPGHTIYRIGGDQGLLETPIAIPPVDVIPNPHEPGEFMSDPDPSKGLLLTPGERADFVVNLSGNGQLPLEWHDFPRGRHSTFYNPDGTIGIGHAHHDGKAPPQTLLTMTLAGPPFGVPWVPPANLRTITPIDTESAGMIMSMFGHMPPDPNGDVVFFAQMKNGMPLPFMAVTPADAPLVTVGDTAIWEVHNMTGGHHNFHLHGFKFQLIETQWIDMDTPANNYTIPASYMEWKDTIFMPERPGAKGRSRTITRLAINFDDTGREGQAEAYGKVPATGFSGGWLFHCHILEHAAQGMMSFLQVMNPVEAATEALLPRSYSQRPGGRAEGEIRTTRPRER